METRATSRRLARASVVRVVVDELGDWSRPGPLYRQLAWAIGRAVERGTLAAGARLPSERALAAALAVSRGTAVAAYDQLVADGILDRLIGSGTFVSGGDTGSLPAGREGSVLVHHLVERSHAASDLIDLSLAVPYDARGLDDVSVSTADLAAVEPPSGYSPWGLASLRAALAARITDWGLPTEADQVVVCTGGQQAISVAAACWVRPGDPVAVEATTYPGIIAALTQLGATLVPVAVDEGGMRPDALRTALASHPVLIYVQSSVHSPTGAVLAEDRRRAIGQLTSDARVPLIEDLALADLAWGALPAPIAATQPGATTVVIGSLGRLFWGGLRLGFARATLPVAVRLARIKATHDLGTPAVDQLLGERLLASAGTSGYPARRRADLRVRYEAMADGLRRHVPSWRFCVPRGGLSLWVELPDAGVGRFAAVAARHGVVVGTPGSVTVGGDDHAVSGCLSARRSISSRPPPNGWDGHGAPPATDRLSQRAPRQRRGTPAVA